MPGRGGGGSKSSGFGRSGAGKTTGSSYARSTRTAPRAQSKTESQSSGGLFGGSGGLGATMAQGAAFGVGSGVAHAAVNSVLGGGSRHGGDSSSASSGDNSASTTGSGSSQSYYDGTQQSPCQSFNEMFLKCLQSNPETIGTCQNEMDSLVVCERDNANIV
ncbi:unnamed protein product [Moneuplotes crassus]|uniref:CHCH domain-containing protein n=2 Tax=Euplotes crassus TaxID=5936 RepID=A0AAD1Y0K3_EUPCR|nr:unnamed protein product [Moneuplotes crassus]